jgi:hypothetical protein
MRFQFLLRALLALAIGAFVPRGVFAQGVSESETKPPEAPSESGTPPGAPAPDEKLTRAKELFRTANTFLKNKDFHRALELFLKSREVVPSYPNTINAAICLDELTRYDEALELYEAALIEFPNDLTPELRASLEPKLRELRDRIGSLEVTSNVSGTVIVDGRERGKVPLTAPIRVLPGERTVRVIKDGYETFEKRVKVATKETARVDAVLKPLASAGRLRVEAPDAEGAELRVDGAVVGKIPWEGTLAPGNHLYEVIRDDMGSGPQRATILQGQVALVRAMLKPLSRTVRFVVTPPTAKVELDGMPIDSAWQGRLTVGKHQLVAREEGYITGKRELNVVPTAVGNVELPLQVNPDHPRWAKGAPSKIWVEGFGGYAIAPSLGSRAEECSEQLPCSEKRLGHGPLAGLRGAYELPIRVSLELGAAYLGLSKWLQRSAKKPFSPTDQTVVTFELLDELEIQGALVSAGVGYRQPFGKIFSLQGRAHLGALISRARDTITGTASAPGRASAPAVIDGSGVEKQGVALVIAPEVQGQLKLGGFRVGLGVTVLLVPLVGPSNEHGDLYPTPPEDPNACSPDPMDSTPLPVGCTGASEAIANERLFGPFVAFAPGLSAGYEF